jgi:hypothetical protein
MASALPASEYIMGGHIVAACAELTATDMSSPATTADATAAPSKKATKGNQKTATEKPEFVRFVQTFMGWRPKTAVPPPTFRECSGSLWNMIRCPRLRGFQISVKDKLT